jgi:hypothetical protein
MAPIGHRAAHESQDGKCESGHFIRPQERVVDDDARADIQQHQDQFAEQSGYQQHIAENVDWIKQCFRPAMISICGT